MKATATERAIAEMLIENTGSHFLDSGIYGRAWQHTRAKFGLDSGLPNSKWDGSARPTSDPNEDEIDRIAVAMRESPAGWIDEWSGVIVDTFHWLTDRLRYDPALDKKFQRYCDLRWAANERPSSELQVAEDFIALVTDREVNYNDIVNTYNHEEALDRTLQFAMFNVEDNGFLPANAYVILQIHGGADVRGGYTHPRLFIGPYEFGEMYDFGEVNVWCKGADVVPDNQISGQITMDGETLVPEHVNHYWDSMYGDGLLTNDDSSEALGFHSDKDEDDDFIETPSTDYHSRGGQITGIRLARKDDDGNWHCPYDGSLLECSGAFAH